MISGKFKGKIEILGTHNLRCRKTATSHAAYLFNLRRRRCGLLQLAPSSELLREADSVTAAFMRACDNGYLRLAIFNAFVDAATQGRIELDLLAIYGRLVDHYMYRKPYDLARRPAFHVSALNDATCRITPLGKLT